MAENSVWVHNLISFISKIDVEQKVSLDTWTVWSVALLPPTLFYQASYHYVVRAWVEWQTYFLYLECKIDDAKAEWLLLNILVWIYVKRTTEILSKSIETWEGVNCLVINVTNQFMIKLHAFPSIFQWNFVACILCMHFTCAFYLHVCIWFFGLWWMNSFQERVQN